MTREEAIKFIAQSVKSGTDMAMVADAIEALKQDPKAEIGKCWVCGKSFEIKPARAKENFYLAVCPKCKEEIRKENNHGKKEKE